MQRNKPLTRVGEDLGKYKLDDTDKRSLSFGNHDKYISREFQKYGYDLAQELGDPKGVSLYIKLAKETPRILLENARSFVRDAYQVQSRPKLFMWKLSQLKEEVRVKNEKK